MFVSGKRVARLEQLARSVFAVKITHHWKTSLNFVTVFVAIPFCVVVKMVQ